MPDKAEVLTPTEARQASPRRLNFALLVGSMLMAIVVAVVLYVFVYGIRRARSACRKRRRRLRQPGTVHDA